MTRYAIGDIHGGSKTFRTLLDRLNLLLGDRTLGTWWRWIWIPESRLFNLGAM